MIRKGITNGAVFFLAFLAAAPMGLGQPAQPAPTSTGATQHIGSGQPTPHPLQSGTMIIGSLEDGTHGHVVIAVPGSSRVWDGNTLGGLYDMRQGNTVSNPNVINGLNRFIRRAYETPTLEVQRGPNESVEQHTARIKQYYDRYVQEGGSARDSWNPITKDKDGKTKLDRVQWTQVPAPYQNAADLKKFVTEWTPPPATNTAAQNHRCDSLVQGASPTVREWVNQYARENPTRANDGNANVISRVAPARAQAAAAAAPTPAPAPVARPPEPQQNRAIPATAPREQKGGVITKPGGVILTAIAEIAGLKPAEVASASFDASAGRLKLMLRSGGTVTFDMDADDFTIAVRTIFDRQVDPALSMSYTADKPGYKAVDYTGPLFKTRFGKIMFEADESLGDVVFNRDGPHRVIAAEIIPNFADLACEASKTRTFGSRVFLRASEVHFRVEDGQLVCKKVTSKVDVEGVRYAADYYQESLHRLARAMDERFDAFAEDFEEFHEFRRLAQCTALAKWLKRHDIAFDWSALKTRAVAEHDFPAFAPGITWGSLFNGRNLDGWRTNLPTGELEWTLQDKALTFRPTSAKALEFLASTWWKDYDVRYVVATKGPVEFIIRGGPQGQAAAVTIDTKGRPQKVELFFIKGEWTAIAGEFGQKGKLDLPEPKKDEPRRPNEFGIRVPPGSTLTLYDASLRTRD